MTTEANAAPARASIRAAIAAAGRLLQETSETHRLDAELLMAHALGVEREAMLLGAQDEDAPAVYDGLVARRAAGEPVAYIVGSRAFWTIELAVGPGVLVPRPDSETLIEAAVAHFDTAGPRTVLDLGTGSGALLLAALDQWPQAVGTGIDRSPAALAIARANAERLGLADRASFREGDWTEGVGERFDLILCNPPYVESGARLPRDVVEWEPPGALFAGSDGLAAYREIIPKIATILVPGGIACIELGAGQEDAVRALFPKPAPILTSRCDLAGHVRCLVVHG